MQAGVNLNQNPLASGLKPSNLTFKTLKVLRTCRDGLVQLPIEEHAVRIVMTMLIAMLGMMLDCDISAHARCRDCVARQSAALVNATRQWPRPERCYDLEGTAYL